MTPNAVTAQAFIDDAGHVSMLDRASFLRRLGESFKGEDVTFTVTKREKSITVQQRRWLRGGFLDQVVHFLVEDCGNAPETIDRDQLHYDFLAIRFGTKAVAALVPGSHPRIVPARTSSDLSAREVSDYYEWIVRYCAEHMRLTIVLPDEWRAQQAPRQRQAVEA